MYSIVAGLIIQGIGLNALGAESQSDSNAPIKREIASDPNVVIGRPIPMSASVRTACTSEPCNKLFQQMAEMAQQPRDLAWAPVIEAELRHLIISEPGNFTIRTLECRKTLCAAEVSSVNGGFHFLARVARDASLNNKLWPDFIPTGTEPNPAGPETGQEVTVSFSMFTRKD
jgi:hypothetical protein